MQGNWKDTYIQYCLHVVRPCTSFIWSPYSLKRRVQGLLWFVTYRTRLHIQLGKVWYMRIYYYTIAIHTYIHMHIYIYIYEVISGKHNFQILIYMLHACNILTNNDEDVTKIVQYHIYIICKWVSSTRSILYNRTTTYL